MDIIWASSIWTVCAAFVIVKLVYYLSILGGNFSFEVGILDESLGLLVDMFPLVFVFFPSITLRALGGMYFSNVSGDSSYSGIDFVQFILSVTS